MDGDTPHHVTLSGENSHTAKRAKRGDAMPGTVAKNRRKTPRRINAWMPYLICWITGAIVVAALFYRHQAEIQALADDYKDKSSRSAHQTANSISHNFSLLYHGLRTIARLPATRDVPRHGSEADDSGLLSIQEIYNNLYSEIAVSEVYLLPAGFDPDKIDPATSKLQEPITTFDHFIIGRNALSPQTAPKSGDVPEIEIFEYRAMRDQLKWFQQHFPDESRLTDLNYPALASKPVITCDNRFFSPLNPDDADRTGLVYSVPFYGSDGKLRGMVSAVLLTRVLQDFLPNSHYAILNRAHDVAVVPTVPGPAHQVKNKLVELGTGDNEQGIFYSQSVALQVSDAIGQWQLWAAYGTEDFQTSPLVVAYSRSFDLALIATLLVTLAMTIILRQQQTRQQLVEQQKLDLESEVEKRTRDLVVANGRLMDANHFKSLFLSRTSHELRTPLNAIIGYIELLMEEPPNAPNGETIAVYRRVLMAAHHLLALINDILDMSRIESGKMPVNLARCNIGTIVGEVIGTVQPLMQKNGNQFCLDCPTMPGDVITDGVKLRQVLINILSNAAKFTQDGKITLRITQSDVALNFVVTDTGKGMTPEQQLRIFDDFAQEDQHIGTEFGGSGLGLSISHRLIRLLGGDIKVSSFLGTGSEFVVTLPIGAAKLSQATRPAAETAVHS